MDAIYEYCARRVGVQREPQNPVDVITALHNTSELLEKRKELIDRQITATNEEVKRILRTPGISTAVKKEMVKRLLLKRLSFERQSVALFDQRSRCEEVRFIIEERVLASQFLLTMQRAAEYMREVGKAHGINDAENIVERLSDNKEALDTLHSALAAPLSFNYDEDQLEAELDALMQSASEPVVAAAVPHPSAPGGAVVIASSSAPVASITAAPEHSPLLVPVAETTSTPSRTHVSERKALLVGDD